MAAVVIMPRQGQSVESCVIAKWHKHKGDPVAVGEVLFTYETDKATFDEEAKADGTLLEVFFAEGDDVACLSDVCVIGEPGEDVSAFTATADESPAAAQLKVSPRARVLVERTGADAAYAVPSGANGRIMARDIEKVIEQGRLTTPAARAAYIPGSGIAGTGIGGRVMAADVAAAPASGARSAAAEFDVVPISGVRKAIANAMHTSLTQSAQLTLHTSFDATELLAFRAKLKAAAEQLSQPVVSLTDMIVYITARVLLNHKSLNAHALDDQLHVYDTVHMGVAVDTPRGLIVPTLFHAERLSLAEVATQTKALAGLCRQGSVSPDLITGGTFTLSNLGAFGIESFTPILNPPQTGLLGVCAIVERSREGRTYPAMGLSLTFDHRALDGADAARFLQELTLNLENFSIIAALH